jgi:hypothetical protein
MSAFASLRLRPKKEKPNKIEKKTKNTNLMLCLSTIFIASPHAGLPLCECAPGSKRKLSQKRREKREKKTSN